MKDLLLNLLIMKEMKVMKDQNIENVVKENDSIQVIVDCDEVTKGELEKFCKIKYELPIINAYAITIKKDKLEMLRAIEGVVKVENDDCLTAQCEDVESDINERINIEKSNLGEGIGVAVLDTGIYPHGDFANGNRLVAFKDFVNDQPYPYDDNGHGTHVAGIIGGDGTESQKKYMGIAPKVNLIGVKILAANGAGNISDVLAGIQWVFDNRDRYNIRVINLSVGMIDKEGEDSILIKGVETAWDNDFFVICAAGNNGPAKYTITTPGISKKVITVGSFSDKTDNELIENYNDYSSRGPTKSCIVKPEVIAHGTNIISCSSDISYKGEGELLKQDFVGYNAKSGTSMAAPVISGIAARLISDFQDITNKDFKIGLKYTSEDIGLSPYQEGWGLVSLERLYKYFNEYKNA